VDGQGEPLVTIAFSKESLVFLGQSKMEVAKSMIEAGLDTVAEISEPQMEIEDELPEEDAVIH